MNNKITATVSDFRKCGYEEYRTFHYSKTFELTATLEDIFTWAKQHKRDIAHVSEIIFSETVQDIV